MVSTFNIKDWWIDHLQVTETTLSTEAECWWNSQKGGAYRIEGDRGRDSTPVRQGGREAKAGMRRKVAGRGGIPNGRPADGKGTWGKGVSLGTKETITVRAYIP